MPANRVPVSIGNILENRVVQTVAVSGPWRFDMGGMLLFMPT